MLTDDFGRPVKSMRIQVNTTCNLKCFFCHMEGTPIQMEKLTPEEIERVVETASRHGVNKIKFTGGEPLLRPDILEIVKRTRKHITGDISMTTNGFRLPSLASKLKEAGLDRVNISMHSIDNDGFEFITGTDGLDRAKEAVAAAVSAGFTGIKVNFVVLRGVNVDQIERMIDFCSLNGATLQLIEYETAKDKLDSENYLKYHQDLGGLSDDLERRCISKGRNELHSRPVYTIPAAGRTVKVELVMPMKNAEFCNNCTRIRLTSTGELKGCLMRSDLNVNIAPLLSPDNGNLLDASFRKAVKMREPYWTVKDEYQDTLLCND